MHTREELLKASEDSTTDNLLGIFASSYLKFDDEHNTTSQPSIVEMTQAAIYVLSRNPKGIVFTSTHCNHKNLISGLLLLSMPTNVMLVHAST